MQGYDLDLIRSVADAVSIPVVAAGGCGNYEHMLQAFKAGAHAVATGAMLQFTENTPKEAARYLQENGVATRLDPPPQPEPKPTYAQLREVLKDCGERGDELLREIAGREGEISDSSAAEIERKYGIG
jgi:tRNA-dihydrouridine synthase